MAAEPELLERGSALEELADALTGGCDGRGGALLIEGPAGIGKTSLLTSARARAEATGMQVLAARGGELESDFAFGVVHQLFEASVTAAAEAEREALLGGAASLAAPLLAPGGSGPDTPTGRDPAWAVMHGLYWLAANLATRAPVMVAVDDAHWVDGASLKWLAYLAARLDGLRITLVLTVRTGEPPRAELTTLVRDPEVHRLSLAPLSRHATDRIMCGALDDPAEEFCAACHAVTGGNPFLFKELLKALADADVAPTGAAAPRVHELGPKSISEAVVARLDRLPAAAHALARAAAVLGTRAPLRHAAALAGLDESSASAAADALAAVEILDGRPLEFVHPVVRAAIYSDLPAANRALRHRRAARLLADEGADPLKVGAHLLASEPAADPEVVELLRRAAREALARAAPESAVVFLRRALSEPVGRDARADLLGELGRSELLARDPAAIQHLVEAVELSSDAEQRLALTFSLAEVLYFAGRMREAHALVTRAIDELSDPDDALLVGLETTRAYMGWGWSDPHHSFQTRDRLPRLRALAGRSGPAGRSLLIYVAVKLTAGGETPAEAVTLVRRGLDGGRFVEDETADAMGAVPAGAILAFHDQLAEAERHVEHMLDDGHRRGSIMGYVGGLAWRAFTALRRGSIAAAETDARRALELIEEHELHFALPFALEFLVEALLERGQFGDCATALGRIALEPLAETLPGAYVLEARGRLCIAEGRPHDAVPYLRRAGETLQAVGIENPNVMAWRSTLALALPADAAQESGELVEAELDRAQRARQARGLGVAMRARGLLTGGDAGISLLEDAADILTECPSALEQALALTELGAALRRANRRADAREPLRCAAELAHRCGASVLARRAHDELQASGARPRSLLRSGTAALTPTERRISSMAAEGLSNPEIAQALFVARKTVENHLSNAYRKLDIRSRGELSRVLSHAVA
ncbi:MAG: ATP-binding protein [Thermoleophilaceae bacterium]